jgi:hypothetical protein
MPAQKNVPNKSYSQQTLRVLNISVFASFFKALCSEFFSECFLNPYQPIFAVFNIYFSKKNVSVILTFL